MTRPGATGAATAAQHTNPRKAATMSGKLTTVRTTLGFDVEADERELVDLSRQGLIATKKDKAAADAAIDEAEARRAKANEGKGD